MDGVRLFYSRSVTFTCAAARIGRTTGDLRGSPAVEHKDPTTETRVRIRHEHVFFLVFLLQQRPFSTPNCENQFLVERGT